MAGNGLGDIVDDTIRGMLPVCGIFWLLILTAGLLPGTIEVEWTEVGPVASLDDVRLRHDALAESRQLGIVSIHELQREEWRAAWGAARDLLRRTPGAGLRREADTSVTCAAWREDVASMYDLSIERVVLDLTGGPPESVAAAAELLGGVGKSVHVVSMVASAADVKLRCEQTLDSQSVSFSHVWRGVNNTLPLQTGGWSVPPRPPSCGMALQLPVPTACVDVIVAVHPRSSAIAEHLTATFSTDVPVLLISDRPDVSLGTTAAALVDMYEHHVQHELDRTGRRQNADRLVHLSLQLHEDQIAPLGEVYRLLYHVRFALFLGLNRFFATLAHAWSWIGKSMGLLYLKSVFSHQVAWTIREELIRSQAIHCMLMVLTPLP